jgi:broad specificity phosphatase PhoE
MGAIYLVRHGQASFGEQNYDVLSDLGHRQARHVGETLRERIGPFEHASSGTLARQIDTARGAAPTGRLVTDERWNEYDPEWILRRYGDPGVEVGPGPSQQLLERGLSLWGKDISTGPESWVAFSSRSNDALNELAAGLGKGETGVVFTSGGVIAAIAARILGAGLDGFIALNRVTVNAGITKIAIGRSGANLLCFNDHAHFDGEHRPLLTFR